MFADRPPVWQHAGAPVHHICMLPCSQISARVTQMPLGTSEKLCMACAGQLDKQRRHTKQSLRRGQLASSYDGLYGHVATSPTCDKTQAFMPTGHRKPSMYDVYPDAFTTCPYMESEFDRPQQQAKLCRTQHKQQQAAVSTAEFTVKHLGRPLQGMMAFGSCDYVLDPYQVRSVVHVCQTCRCMSSIPIAQMPCIGDISHSSNMHCLSLSNQWVCQRHQI